MASSNQTRTANDFLQSIGVNTHLSWQDLAGYANPSVVEKSIAYLGATHVRDGIPYTGWTLPEYEAIAQAGVKFDIIASGPAIDIAKDVAQAVLLDQAVPGSVAAMEGANEFNTQNSTFNGASSAGNPAWVQQYGPALYSAVKSNPTLSGAAVIAASMANAGAPEIQKEGNVSSFVDSSNWHTYFGNGNQPAGNLATAISNAKATAPGKPFSITETGYYTAVDATDWGGGGVSPAVQAVLTVNTLLDAFNDGVATTYLYELMNNVASPASTDLEGNFGLFLADGTPKPAATAIRNLTTLLADPGSKASTFQAGTLPANITGLPSTGSSMTLEKSDGTYDLVVWNEPKVWDEASRSAVSPSATAVSVDLGATYHTVRLYDPLAGMAAFQTLTDVGKVSLSLAADPVIIEIDPAKPTASSTATAAIPAAAAAPAAAGAGTTAAVGTLTLHLSEDAWQGNAQFLVSVDGKALNAATEVTALHKDGTVQDFAFAGSFGAGPHDVAVSFLNDAYGGSAATDRNLYVNAIDLDSQHKNVGAVLYGNGTQHFSIG